MIEPVDLPEVEFTIQDKIFIKQMFMARAGTFVPQHSHSYEHASMLATGSVRVWQDDELKGDFKAPIPINIPAGVKHTFMSLEPNTLVLCIHNIERALDRIGASAVDIHEHAESINPKIIQEGVLCLGQQQRQQ